MILFSGFVWDFLCSRKSWRSEDFSISTIQAASRHERRCVVASIWRAVQLRRERNERVRRLSGQLEPETGDSKSRPPHFSHETGHTPAVGVFSLAAIVAPVVKIVAAFLVAI